MGGWMETARANARAMDQAMKQNPYKERLRQAGEYARKNGLAPQSVQTASSAIKPTEIKIADPMAGLRSRESSQYLLSDNLKAAGEQMKDTVNARLVTDGEFANTAVKNLRANGQTEAADNLKSQLDALERERHIAELREKQAAQSSQKIPAPKPVLPQYSNSYFASPGVKEIGENLITRYNAQAMLDYMGSREYAHKQETARKRAQAEADAIYKEMQEYIANPNVNALDDPKILDYRNRYNAALAGSTPSKTQEWETEQYLDILATGGTSLLEEFTEHYFQLRDAVDKASVTNPGVQNNGAWKSAKENYDRWYNGMVSRLGKDNVDRWIEYGTRIHDQQVAEEFAANVRAHAQEHGVGDSILSVPLHLASGIGFIDAVGQKIGNVIAGKDYPVNYNTPIQRFSGIATGIRGAVSDEIAQGKGGQIGSFLYNTGMSMLDSATMIATGNVGAAMLGGAAANNAMKEAKQRGASDNQAFAIGLISAIAEGVMEKASIDKLFGQQNGKGVRDAIWNVLKQAGAEGTEEGLTNIVNTVADAFIMGDKSQLNATIDDYMADGYSEQEATRMAIGEWAKNFGLDVVGGAISGSAFSIGKGGYDAFYNINKPNALGIDGIKGAVAGITIPPEQFRQLQLDYAKEHGWKTDWDELEQVFFRLGLEMGYGDDLYVSDGQGGEQHFSREQVKELSDMYNQGVYQLFRDVLKENAPSTLEEFSQIRYDNGEAWQQLKKQYEVVERYEPRGDVPVDQIIELDEIAYRNKTGAFDYSKFHGDERKYIKGLAKSGNAAVVVLDGKLYFSHSAVETEGTMVHDSYAGEHPLVGFSNKRIFKTLDLKDGVLRQYDTEAKFLEYVASIKTDRSEAFEVTILSEKHICKSCEYVVEQFKKLFPNATVNIVSGNPNYGDVNSKGEHGMKTWQHRKD